jgi:hypothetical protein
VYLQERADQTLDVDVTRSPRARVDDELADGLLKLLEVSSGDVVARRQGCQP